MNKQKIGLLILRLSLAAVFLWFGFSQIFDSIRWVYIVPDWAVNLLHIPPAMIVLANGVFEIVAGALIAMNIFVRPVLIALALHLAVITIDMGMSPVGVRDFGLTMATVSLALLYNPKSSEPVVE